MIDDRQFRVARARFDALRRNIPLSLKKEDVAEYHSILDALQTATGEDLSAFRIPNDQFKKRITGATRATMRSPGRLFIARTSTATTTSSPARSRLLRLTFSPCGNDVKGVWMWLVQPTTGQ
jgi:hypothetical protein